MKKVSKLLATTSVLGMAVVAAACSKSGGAGSGTLEMWVGFGNDYTGEITRVVGDYNNSGASKYSINLTTKGAYTKLEKAIVDSYSGRSFPNFANGYPDHFAEYAHKQILLPLNSYIADWNQKNGKDLMADFYDAYEKENEEIIYAKNSDTKYIMGLPFNKSTEVMLCNGYLWDYVKSVDSSIEFPNTWQKLRDNKEKIITAMADCFTYKYLYGTVNGDGVAENFEVSNSETAPAGKRLLQDVSEVDANSFRVLGYDDGGNLFVTLMRQWGSLYTDFSKEIYFASPAEYGCAAFWRTDYKGVNYKTKTTEALNFVKDLYVKKGLGLPKSFDESQFCTTPFKKGKCLFTVGSSGGLSNSVDANKRIEIHAIPYYDDGTTVRKFVISQGTSLALFNQFSDKSKAAAEQQAAFDAMVALCTGEYQGDWVSSTGYFPSCESAMNSTSYKALLNDTNPTPLRKMYQEAARLNKNVYDGEGWTKFTDPGFYGSTTIRDAVGSLIYNVSTSTSSLESEVDSVWAKVPEQARNK